MAGFRLGAVARSAGYRLTAYDEIGSTNGEALAAAKSGDPGGHWFVTDRQLAGRGRRGRPWEGPRGNLAATLLLVPDAEPELNATLGFVAGLALYEALARVLPQVRSEPGADGRHLYGGNSRIALKWPNDVLADGQKLAGILLEATSRPGGRPAIAIGIGVNVAVAPEGLPYPAESVRSLGGDADAAEMFEALGDAWVSAFSLWRDGEGVEEVLARWRAAATGLGGPVAVQQDGAVIRGIFESIDGAGRLIIRADDDSRIAISAGDVHFGATASARS
ncbi:biotin--[acetyl-CoA-carboxylase] ligase [Arsenicitalea aurantiaca]|uniref:biotin--[biotin carboxyl-carrier protein] ligase n=1 Tax=Arsenicitalea aurantiaca TaxID=1783274 RepID=A0A433XFD0_9HYPH|nr:biotin--[acetyl-CoA-carboxylase] ligase [Arsenicitalea aurantiaca]RUT32714.1 biotin--[acetyl-CoA-carboxylase] ligase [Arsenicitalea aurantiaca]